MVTSRADGKNCIKDTIWRLYDHKKMADNYRQFPPWQSIIKWKGGEEALKFIFQIQIYLNGISHEFKTKKNLNPKSFLTNSQ